MLFRLCREINILRNLVVIKHLADRDSEINRLSQTVTKLDQKIKQALKEIRKYTGIFFLDLVSFIPKGFISKLSFRYDARNDRRNSPYDIFAYSYIYICTYIVRSPPCVHSMKEICSLVIHLGVSKTRQIWKNISCAIGEKMYPVHKPTESRPKIAFYCFL